MRKVHVHFSCHVILQNDDNEPILTFATKIIVYNIPKNALRPQDIIMSKPKRLT